MQKRGTKQTTKEMLMYSLRAKTRQNATLLDLNWEGQMTKFLRLCIYL